MSQENELYRPSLWVRFRRWAMRSIFWFVFHALFKVKLEGFENIPKHGAYIIAYNHVSYFEPPFILTFWPTAPEALAGADVWHRPGQGEMVKLYGALPVKRGEYDRTVLEKMDRVLKAGYPLAISPEGGRSNTPGMRRAYQGVAYLIDRVRVPVVPVAVLGSRDDSLLRALKGDRHSFYMRIGKPFDLPPIEGSGPARRDARQRNADEVMLQIGKMLPEEYHGVYAGKISK